MEIKCQFAQNLSSLLSVNYMSGCSFTIFFFFFFCRRLHRTIHSFGDFSHSDMDNSSCVSLGSHKCLHRVRDNAAHAISNIWHL